MKSQSIRRTLRRLNREDGQGMTEYIIIVALIAIAAIGVVTLFGRDIRELFAASTGALSGDTNSGSAAIKAKIKTSKGLKDFSKSTQTGD